MKISIIGIGSVGSAVATAVVNTGLAHEIVLFDRDGVRALAAAEDLGHAAAFSYDIKITAVNNYRSILIKKEFQENLLLLANRLSRTSGKKVYGYLKQDVKQIVDNLVEQLDMMPEIHDAYAVWKEWQYAVDDMYGTKVREPLQLSREKKLKVIKNMVIQSALEIDLCSGTIEEKQVNENNRELYYKETILTEKSEKIHFM